MFKKKAVFFISGILMLIVIMLILKENLRVAKLQEKSLKIKHQLELQQAQTLKDMDKSEDKANSKEQTVAENVYPHPYPEPDEYKVPYQWSPGGFTQRHGLIKTANTVWTVKGILEPNQEVWDEFVAWSGDDEDGKQVIGTFVDNGQIFNGKYDSLNICPNQKIGKLYINDVKGDILYFKTDSGITGNFDLVTHNWIFDIKK